MDKICVECNERVILKPWTRFVWNAMGLMILSSNSNQILRWSSKLVEMVSLLVKFIHNFMPWFWPLVSRSLVGTCRFKILPLPNDVGPQNLTVGCWELNLNLSHPVQLSRASHYYILRVHKTRDQRWVMLWCIVTYVSFMLTGDFSCSDTFLDQGLFLITFFLIGHNIYMSGPWQRL